RKAVPKRMSAQGLGKGEISLPTTVKSRTVLTIGICCIFVEEVISSPSWEYSSMPRMFRVFLLFAGSFLAALAGCKTDQKDDTPPLSVPVARPVMTEVQDFVDYTGRTNAVISVTIQARVT